jgi:uncharacterized membrane protein YkoI
MKTIIFSLFFISMLLLNTLVHAAAEGISKQQAVNIATQSYAGRVLAVKRKANDYQVKILSDSGKVQVIRVDAESGKIKPGSQDDMKPNR